MVDEYGRFYSRFYMYTDTLIMLNRQASKYFIDTFISDKKAYIRYELFLIIKCKFKIQKQGRNQGGKRGFILGCK